MTVTPIPIVVAYFGTGPGYLRIALRSAAAHNVDVVMIGDAANRGFWRYHVDGDRLAADKLHAFRESLVKMSDYPQAYEDAFWRRPFMLEAWMRADGVERVMLLDSDVVTFSDYGRDVVARWPERCGAGLMTLDDQQPFDWATSLHFSCWTLEALSDFTEFCLAAYRRPEIRRQLEAKYRRHLERGDGGGICEMTLLYLWRLRHEAEVFNLADASNGTAGDLAVSTPDNHHADEYAMHGRLKQLAFHHGQPYAFNRHLDAWVRLLCVHCQGDSKRLMRFLAERHLCHLHGSLFAADRAALRVRARATVVAQRAAGVLGALGSLFGI